MFFFKNKMVEKNNWPLWANEKVKIVPYESTWPQIAIELIDELNIIEEVCELIQIEHIGSTSVKGLSAKPIIDIIATIETFNKLDFIIDILLAKEWHFVPTELDQRPYRRFFVKVKNNKRIAHLHLMLPNTKKWDELILFRNKLRESEALVSAYIALKLSLATLYKEDREAYSNAKAKFINEVLSS